jgi:hypothetical protein
VGSAEPALALWGRMGDLHRAKANFAEPNAVRTWRERTTRALQKMALRRSSSGKDACAVSVCCKSGPSSALAVRHSCIKHFSARTNHLGTGSAANVHPALALGVSHAGVSRQGGGSSSSLRTIPRPLRSPPPASSQRTRRRATSHGVLRPAHQGISRRIEMKVLSRPSPLAEAGEVMGSEVRVTNCPACCFGAHAASSRIHLCH